MRHRAFTPKQRLFIKEYLIDRNATRAYRAAFGERKGAAQSASRMLRNAKVAAAVEKGLAKQEAKLELTAERNLQRLAHWAYEARVKASDSIRACELIGKHFGSFSEKVETTTDNHVQVILTMPSNGSEAAPSDHN